MIVGVLAAAAGLLAQVPFGCDERTRPGVQSVKIGGRWFHLELALDDRTRFKGLGGRSHIEADGGMLFVFPDAQPRAFVMRDCAIPIDIIYLDGTGRVVSMHAMQPDPPRTEAEQALSPPVPGAPEWAWVNPTYEARLTQYPSRFPTQFVIELRGGTLPGLKLKEGDRIDLPVADLRRQAR